MNLDKRWQGFALDIKCHYSVHFKIATKSIFCKILVLHYGNQDPVFCVVKITETFTFSKQNAAPIRFPLIYQKSKTQSGHWVDIIDHWSIIDHFA